MLQEVKVQLVAENKVMDTEIDLSEVDLGQIELEKRRVKNIREKAALMLELIDQDTKVDYTFPPRSKFEVRGGYRIAVKRGARLKEVKVYNMYFRLFNRRLNATSIALMYRDENKQERILLLPDCTEERIKLEVRENLDAARTLVFQNAMDNDYQDYVVQNLRLLSVPERCAQSLMHEYGHILHWRIFDQLSLHTLVEKYRWFLESGYVQNIMLRIPNFKFFSIEDQVYYLKESFVEDYRIGLNMQSQRGMFILPNVVTRVGDFQNPNLLYQGVNIVSKMLKNGLDKRSNSDKPFESSHEPDRVAMSRMMLERYLKYGMGPEMTHEDHLAVIAELEELDKKQKKQDFVVEI